MVELLVRTQAMCINVHSNCFEQTHFGTSFELVWGFVECEQALALGKHFFNEVFADYEKSCHDQMHNF